MEPKGKTTARGNARGLSDGSTAKYRDRPTDDGMKGDGAEAPNTGAPRLPKQGPSRQAHTKRRTSPAR